MMFRKCLSMLQGLAMKHPIIVIEKSACGSGFLLGKIISFGKHGIP